MKYFLTGLGLVFIAAKLFGAISWSWWLVTLPLWGGVALLIIAFIAALIIATLSDD